MKRVKTFEEYKKLTKIRARKMMYIRDPKEVEVFLNSPEALNVMEDNYNSWITMIKEGRETPNSFGGAVDDSVYCLDLMF